MTEIREGDKAGLEKVAENQIPTDADAYVGSEAKSLESSMQMQSRTMPKKDPSAPVGKYCDMQGTSSEQVKRATDTRRRLGPGSTSGHVQGLLSYKGRSDRIGEWVECEEKNEKKNL